MSLSDRKRKKSPNPKSGVCGGDNSRFVFGEKLIHRHNSEQMLAMDLAQADNQIVFQAF